MRVYLMRFTNPVLEAVGDVEHRRGTYRDLDAFQIIEDGRVMVVLDVPNQRMPEEYVPAERFRGAVEAIERAVQELPLTLVGSSPSDYEDGPSRAGARLRLALRALRGQ